ncbi:ABC transporter ATP-binding protein [soil metagenome]
MTASMNKNPSVPLLEVKGMEASYDSTRVIKGIDFQVPRHGITAILGANGAGKTTALRALSALVTTTGEITLDGERVDGLKTEQIASRGVAHVPDGRGTILALSVEENLRIGGYLTRKSSQVASDMKRIFDYFPRLFERRAQQSGTLSGGEQQMLAIGRALMSRPRLLMLDEPSFGLAPLVIKEIFSIMRKINVEEKVGILLVEQNVMRALELADQVYLLEVGSIAMSGTPDQFLANDQIRRSYLGD